MGSPTNHTTAVIWFTYDDDDYSIITFTYMTIDLLFVPSFNLPMSIKLEILPSYLFS